jgi:hypothetical protein
MTAELDLNFLPFHRISGKDRPSLPGLMLTAPPRRAARGREADLLFIYLTLASNMPVSLDEYTKSVAQMVRRFYETAGSLTAALRLTADMLNQSLLNRNLATTGQGQYIVGRLVLGVLRGRQLLVVQSGPTHFFQVGKNAIQHLFDPELSGRGLGFSQTTPLYYSQLELVPGDQLVMSAQLPEGWDAALSSERGGTSLEALSRKLQVIPNEHVNAALIQVQAGKGKMNLLSALLAESFQTPAVTKVPVPRPGLLYQPEVDMNLDEPDSNEPQSGQPLVLPASMDGLNQPSEPDLAAESTPSAQPSQPGPINQTLKDSGPGNEPPVESLQASIMATPPKEPSRQAGKSQFFNPANNRELRHSAIARQLLAGLQAVRKFGRTVADGFQTLFKRTLPGQADERSSAWQGSTMAFIAVIVPLTVVVIASTIYMRFGRSAQYEANYSLAMGSAMGAIDPNNDPAITHQAWQDTLKNLNVADQYMITKNSRDLRQLAQSALDGMDQIIRLDFHFAISGGLSKTVQIRHMAANETDLYMLNETQGNVIRAFMTGQGYEVDPNFMCGPGNYSSKGIDSKDSFDVGNILDIVALPRSNSFDVTVMGIDARGTLIFCSPDAEPQAWKLDEPSTLWNELNGFTMGAKDNALYVFDPAGNAVWVYTYVRATGVYGQSDMFFSGDYVPKNLSTMVDISVSGTDLYLLSNTGQITYCTPGQGDKIARCSDPENMVDTRAGGQTAFNIPGVKFTTMMFSSAPDPSLYMLDPVNAAIFRFSPRPDSLYMQNQYHAAVDQEISLFTSPISAMAIGNSPNRYIFVCVGNQIYFATDVP